MDLRKQLAWNCHGTNLIQLTQRNSEELIGIMNKVREIIKSYKDVPLIYNINDPNKISHEDPRIIASMDAFLYERGESILQRAEGVSLARALGITVMPYVGGYDNWPRIVNNQLDIQQ